MKVGKTTFASQAPKNLLIAAEHGYNALAGVKAQDINKWSDFLMVIKQLASEKAKEMYDTVSIDTIGQLWEFCEQFICTQNNVKKIGEIPWGKLHHCPLTTRVVRIKQSKNGKT